MSFSKILEKLFKNSGQGPSLSDNVTTELVHKAGDEVISGKKIFEANRRNEGSRVDPIFIKHTLTERGITPIDEYNDYSAISFQDKNGKRVGMLEYANRGNVHTDGSSTDIKISVYKKSENLNEGSDFGSLLVGYDETNDVFFAKCPSTSSSRTDYGTDIVTRNWLASDSRLVHTSGDETIDGKKTFIGQPSNIYDNIYGAVFRNQKVTKGTTPSNNQYISLQLCDGSTDEKVEDGQANGRLGLFETAIFGSGETRSTMACVKNVTDVYDIAALYVGFDVSGNPYVRSNISTPISNPDNLDLLTRDWIPNDDRIVHTSGAETINGTKTFTESINIKRSNPYIHFIETDITRFTANTNIPYQGLYFKDKNEDMYACFIGQTYADFSYLSLYVYDENDDYTFARLVRANDGSDSYFSIPTPSSDSTGNEGVTAEWVNNKNYVTSTAAQTISGSKTFTQSVIIHRGNPYLILEETDVTRGTGPDSGATSYSGIYFEDKNSDTLGGVIGYFYAGSKSFFSVLRADDCRNAAQGSSNTIVGAEFSSAGVKSFRPEPSADILLGTSSRKWKEVWCSQSSINSSSDERLKTEITATPDEVLDAWSEVNWIQYKFKSSISEKGSAARFHSGAIAQQVNKVFSDRGLDISKYGLFLHDEWDAVEETRDKDGMILSYASPAGDEYGLRYTEALCMEAAYNRRRVSRVEERLLALEQELAELKKNS